MSFFIHKKEKHIVENIKKHADTVVETVSLAQLALEMLLEGKREESTEYTKKVHKKEHDADVIRREIDKEMFGGAFMPSIREALFITVDTVDKVANRAEKLGDFITLVSPDIPDDIRGYLREMGKLTVQCAEKMREAIHNLFEDIKVVHKDTTEVDHMESRLDKFAWKIMETIFKKLEIEKFSHRMMLREMVIHLSSISNKMEDAADRIDIIALKLKS
jgi:predicted phosphate transport protein (TIGR00153 family)